MINRSSVIVRPKQPYIDWARSVDPEGEAPDSDTEATVYLVPEYEDDEETQDMIAQCFSIIFEAELAGWHNKEDKWPQHRTRELFLDWFEIEYNSIVEDLCGYEISENEEF